ncbi:MAG: hypothetical protein D3903_12235 [Candidatus Electrothrix sp. GM3_4]|nr:hypothetical protein [Candidatus Electrothrix sp. GM3_4]
MNTATIFFTTLFLAGCQQDTQNIKNKVLKEMPAKYTLSSHQIVYVENNGSCDRDQVIKVTGEKKSKGISRKYECSSRSE